MKNKIITFIFVGGVGLVGAGPTLMEHLGLWEGHRNVVYADKLAGGLPTVCKGITKWVSPYPVVVGDRWPDEKCESVEREVTIKTQLELAKCIKRDIPQSVFDALSSHAHNFGYPRTCGSASVREINAGNLKKGCDLLAYTESGQPNWSSASGRFVQGLHNRRKAERELCLKDLR